MKMFYFIVLLLCFGFQIKAQENQTQTQLKLKQLIEKKAEYHKLTGGETDGYRIKIYFGIDREAAKLIKTKFSQKFNTIDSDIDYQQPNFVVLAGAFKSKLEATEQLKKIQIEFPQSFIIKGKIKAKS
ncbi:MAG: SPOR domain-containing protein [Bacteroidetes bacterium]|nr:SPOR domain-containing protein [Bacteroidota bacterium]